MAKIIGNTTATPNPRSDWQQTDESKADFIKNKPTLGRMASKDTVEMSDLSDEVQSSLGGGSGGGGGVSATNYTIYIPNTEESWVAVDGGYTITKSLPGLTEQDDVFPSLSNGELWTNNGFDVLLSEGIITVFVNSVPVEESELTITVVKAIDGGEL